MKLTMYINTLNMHDTSMDASLKNFISERSLSDPFSVVDNLSQALSSSRRTPDFEVGRLWQAISVFYPYLTINQQQRAVSAIYALEDRESRAYILSALVPSLADVQKQLAIETILHDTLTMPERMLVLSQLIDSAPAELQDTVIDAALDTASITSTDLQCFNALLTIAAYIGLEEQNTLLNELFTDMSVIYHEDEKDNAYSRGWDLGKFGDILTDAQGRFIIDRVKVDTHPVIEPDIALNFAFSHLVPFDAELAVTAVRSISSPVMRASAMRSSLTEFSQQAPWFIQQIVNDLMQEPITRGSIYTLLDFLPFLQGEQKQTALEILLDTVLKTMNDEKWMPFYQRIIPQLDSTQRQTVWNKLNEITDGSERSRLMRAHIPFLPEPERIAQLQFLWEQGMWGKLLNIWRDMPIADQVKAPIIQTLLAHLFLEMKDKTIAEILETLSYFNDTYDPRMQFFTPRFFSPEVLQGLGECLLQVNGW